MTTDHLALARQYLFEDKENPGLAVCRYVAAIAPAMHEDDAISLSAFLVGSVASMIARTCTGSDEEKVKWLAALVVASILPAGVELGRV